MTVSTLAIIGVGNMGSSLLGGLLAANYPAKKLWATNSTVTKLTAFATRGVQTTTNNKEAVTSADIVILAVKPQVLRNVALEIAPLVQDRKPLIISVAASIRETTLQQWLGGACPIVRCMPNTPSLIGCGASGLFANAQVTLTQKNIAETILKTLGLVVWLKEEKLLDAVTALSGSGPAYFFLFFEILQQAGEALGLPKDIARVLALQTGWGATRMAMESPESIMELRQRVTSKGGTTEAALQFLENHNFRRTLTDALQAAHNRSVELGSLLVSSELKNA